MNVLDAVTTVLKESGTSLHVKEITRRILSRKLWNTSGKTPVATVGARVYSDIKKNGDASPFVLHSPATFRLRETASPVRPATETKPESSVTRVAKKRGKTSFSFTDSAEKVLEQFADMQPMHYQAITEKAFEMGWLSSKGKTPGASMNSQIRRSIERSERLGEQPRFTQLGKGLIGLSRWMAAGLALEIEQHNKKIREELHRKLLEMDWDAFEDLVTKFLLEMGFEIDDESANKVGDGGIDEKWAFFLNSFFLFLSVFQPTQKCFRDSETQGGRSPTGVSDSQNSKLFLLSLS